MRKFFSLHFINHLIHGRYYGLVIADSLRNVSLSMIAFFVPLFLLEKGFSIFNVAFYYLGFYVACIFAHYFVLKIINFIGVKRGLMISYLSEICFYIILCNYENISALVGNNLYLAILIIPAISAIVTYWTAHHIYFFVASHARHEGRKLGLLYSIPNALGIFAPFLGGFLITVFDFEITFFVSVILLILASFVLSLSKNIIAEIDIKIEKVFDFNSDAKNWIFFVDGAKYFTSGIIWPIYMFVMSISFLSIGFIYIFCNFGHSAACYIAGKINDNNGSRKIGRIGAIGHSFTLAARAFTANVLSMSTTLFFGGIFSALLQVSLDSGFYKHSHANIGSAMLNRELYMHLGRITMILIFILCLLAFNLKIALMIIMIITAVLTFMLNFFIKKDNSIIE